METTLATVLGLLVIMLVLGTFMAQLQLHKGVATNVGSMDLLEAAAAVAMDEVRFVARDGMVHAEADSLVYRHPLLLATVCGASGSTSHLHFPLDGKTVESGKVAGGAPRSVDGAWIYYDAT